MTTANTTPSPIPPTVSNQELVDNKLVRDLYRAAMAAADQDMPIERVCEIVRGGHAKAIESGVLCDNTTGRE